MRKNVCKLGKHFLDGVGSKVFRVCSIGSILVKSSRYSKNVGSPFSPDFFIRNLFVRFFSPCSPKFRWNSEVVGLCERNQRISNNESKRSVKTPAKSVLLCDFAGRIFIKRANRQLTFRFVSFHIIPPR